MAESDNKTSPVWQNDIENLFAKPYWIKPESKSESVGKYWIGKMGSSKNPKESYNFGIQLDVYASVKQWSRQIYLQIKSGNMPMTEKKEYLFPKEAVDRFYLWITEGCRETHESEVVHTTIKVPTYEPPRFRVRRDIATLTEEELNIYRAAIDDYLNPVEEGHDSKWQELCYIHTDWCLHYQEGFLPWHRAHLMYMESIIDCGIPYWNWMAKNAANPEDESSGLPQAFLDEKYKHPTTGDIRDNPLKYARAKDGVSKGGTTYATRAPALLPDADPAERGKYIQLMALYQRQIVEALENKSFSKPQGYLGTPGYPWTNIPEFNPPQKLEDYIKDFNGDDIGMHFDNLLEQPHDNFHGWLGPDMADNSTTAFDPIFWSFHANMDRVFETWLRKNPSAQFTSSFPLRPFVGVHGSNISISEGDERAWIHSTIGDMTKGCKSLGYIYLPPKQPDLLQGVPDTLAELGKTDSMVLLQAFSTDVNADEQNSPDRKAYVLFEGVRCTDETYIIDVFLKAKNRAPLAGAELDSDVGNPYFVGTSARIGMGDAVSVDSKGKRCVKKGITRLLPISLIPAEIENLEKEDIEVVLKVTNLSQGSEVNKEDYEKLSGFTGKFFWNLPRI